MAKIDLLAVLESAAIALARLDEALRRSPVAAGWALRAQLRGACTAANDEGFDVAPERLWPAIIGAPTRLERDYGALRRTLQLYHIITRLARRPIPRRFRLRGDETTRDELARIYQLERRIRQDNEGALAALAAAATRPDRDRPRSHYRLAMAALCRRRGALSCIAPSVFPRADPRITRTSTLASLAANAHKARQEVHVLEQGWRKAHNDIRCSGKTVLRRGASLPRLIDLLYAVEAVPPRWGAKLLGVSEPQMGRMLARLAELGLAQEITGRGSHRLWTTPDVILITRGRPVITVAPSPAHPGFEKSPPNWARTAVEPAESVNWAEILDNVDRAISSARRTIADDR